MRKFTLLSLLLALLPLNAARGETAGDSTAETLAKQSIENNRCIWLD
ncbi:MAG: hypothetical protein PHC51_06555 [bacterium]|nr:hypothetical protein [bacterium]